MDDPNRRKTLQDSIRKIGTCQQMCDEKERVDRMFENLVDLAETVRLYGLCEKHSLILLGTASREPQTCACGRKNGETLSPSSCR